MIRAAFAADRLMGEFCRIVGSRQSECLGCVKYAKLLRERGQHPVFPSVNAADQSQRFERAQFAPERSGGGIRGATVRRFRDARLTRAPGKPRPLPVAFSLRLEGVDIIKTDDRLLASGFPSVNREDAWKLIEERGAPRACVRWSKSKIPRQHERLPEWQAHSGNCNR